MPADQATHSYEGGCDLRHKIPVPAGLTEVTLKGDERYRFSRQNVRKCGKLTRVFAGAEG